MVFSARPQPTRKADFELKGIPPGSYKISAFQKNEDDGGYEIRGQQKVWK